MKILVSACLLGENCKYNGGNNYSPSVVEYVKDREVIPVCPELAAGFGCPRIPMEIVDGVLINRDGVNLDQPMRQAIAEILKSLGGQEIQCAILKSRSPTCGVRQVYDGSFTGTLTDGAGVLAQALMDEGCQVYDSEDLPRSF